MEQVDELLCPSDGERGDDEQQAPGKARRLGIGHLLHVAGAEKVETVAHSPAPSVSRLITRTQGRPNVPPVATRYPP